MTIDLSPLIGYRLRQGVNIELGFRSFIDSITNLYLKYVIQIVYNLIHTNSYNGVHINYVIIYDGLF